MSGTTHTKTPLFAKPTLRFTQDVWQKLACLVMATPNTECSWIGLCDEQDACLITQLIIPEQTNTASSTEFDEKDVMEQVLGMGLDPERIVLWGHSHDAHGIFWSGTDAIQSRKLNADIQWCMVLNRKTARKMLSGAPLAEKDVYVRLDIHQRSMHTSIGEWLGYTVEAVIDNDINITWAETILKAQATKRTPTIVYSSYPKGQGQGHSWRTGKVLGSTQDWAAELAEKQRKRDQKGLTNSALNELDQDEWERYQSLGTFSRKATAMTYVEWGGSREKAGQPKPVAEYHKYVARWEARYGGKRKDISTGPVAAIPPEVLRDWHPEEGQQVQPGFGEDDKALFDNSNVAKLPAHYLRYIVRVAQNLLDPVEKDLAGKYPDVAQWHEQGLVTSRFIEDLQEQATASVIGPYQARHLAIRNAVERCGATYDAVKKDLTILAGQDEPPTLCHWIGGFWWETLTGRRVFPDPEQDISLKDNYATSTAYAALYEWLEGKYSDPEPDPKDGFDENYLLGLLVSNAPSLCETPYKLTDSIETDEDGLPESRRTAGATIKAIEHTADTATTTAKPKKAANTG